MACARWWAKRRPEARWRPAPFVQRGLYTNSDVDTKSDPCSVAMRSPPSNNFRPWEGK